MLEIKLTVELPGIPEAINNLAGALRERPKSFDFGATDVEPKDTPAITAANEPIPFPGDQVAGTPASEAAHAPNPATTAAVPAAPVTPVKKYTFAQISTAGAKLCANTSKMDQLVSLLNTKYGVPAITMIDESRYAELAADLIALGATIEGE